MQRSAHYKTTSQTFLTSQTASPHRLPHRLPHLTGCLTTQAASQTASPHRLPHHTDYLTDCLTSQATSPHRLPHLTDCLADCLTASCLLTPPHGHTDPFKLFFSKSLLTFDSECSGDADRLSNSSAVRTGVLTCERCT